MTVCERPPSREKTRFRILVVEDDESMQDYYRYFFGGRTFGWSMAASAERALDLLRTEISRPFDLIVLDWGLPRMSGIQLLEAVRGEPSFAELPVLMVSSRTDVDGRVAALNEGADDFLTKPFEYEELEARVRSILRRTSDRREQTGSLRLKDLELCGRTHGLYVKGAWVHLSPYEFELLAIFIRRPDMIHSARYLWDAVWGHENSNSANILQVTISKLRKKLGPKWGPRLSSERSFGYLLDAHGA